MVRRIFLLTSLFFMGYNAALYLPAVKSQFWMDQGQRQQNIIRAQEFAMGRRDYNAVIVGSSLAARLPQVVLGGDVLNLGFSGGSIYTGLKLVAVHPTPPKMILIETNLIMRGEDRDILNSVQMPVVSGARFFLPGLCEKYEPSNFLAGRVVYQLLARTRGALGLAHDQVIDHAANSSDASYAAPLRDPASALFDMEVRFQSVPPDKDELAHRLDELQVLIYALRQRCVRCVFLEMPVHDTLTNSAYARAIRSALKERFPVGEVAWVIPPLGKSYHPRDGVHLSGDEAADFARYIRMRIAHLWAVSDVPDGL